eukprot:COSAG04_NODE_3553_length_2715_cov_1.279434_3_plen_61_part_00
MGGLTAISTTRSIPSSSMSPIVKTLCCRSRMLGSDSRGTCQPPMPIWTRLEAGTFGSSVA